MRRRLFTLHELIQYRNSPYLYLYFSYSTSKENLLIKRMKYLEGWCAGVQQGNTSSRTFHALTFRKIGLVIFRKKFQLASILSLNVLHVLSSTGVWCRRCNVSDLLSRFSSQQSRGLPRTV